MNIHFVGIGGIGTSSIAQILHHRGHKVSGSDTTASSITRSLKLSGIKVTIGHTEKNITKKLDKVIYSPAIPPTNPELKKANALKIETISYPQALGDLSKKYFTIAVSGAHGKSTTTAMISLIAKNAGLDPSVVIGTKIPQFKNKNYRVGDSNLLIVEACEYKRSFLHLHPDILVITNIEAEHLDYYKNLKDYIHAFTQIAKKSKKIIIDPTNKNSKTAVKGIKKEIIHIDKTTPLTPSLPGKFNITNATFAATAAKLLNIDQEIIQNSIHSFKGTWRRLEYKKTKFKTTFIDDYGHHPTEIELTLNAIRERHPKDKMLVIFQPHQYNRTKMLLKEFGKVFYEADEVIIPNIYQVRDSEKDINSVSAQDLVDEINKHSPKKAKDGHSLKETADYIKKNHKKYDLIVTMGAGDIDGIYKLL